MRPKLVKIGHAIINVEDLLYIEISNELGNVNFAMRQRTFNCNFDISDIETWRAFQSQTIAAINLQLQQLSLNKLVVIENMYINVANIRFAIIAARNIPDNPEDSDTVIIFNDDSIIRLPNIYDDGTKSVYRELCEQAFVNYTPPSVLNDPSSS